MPNSFVAHAEAIPLRDVRQGSNRSYLVEVTIAYFALLISYSVGAIGLVLWVYLADSFSPLTSIAIGSVIAVVAGTGLGVWRRTLGVVPYLTASTLFLASVIIFLVVQNQPVWLGFVGGLDNCIFLGVVVAFIHNLRGRSGQNAG